MTADAKLGDGLTSDDLRTDRGAHHDAGAVSMGVSSRSRPAPSSIEARPMHSASMPVTKPLRAARHVLARGRRRQAA